MNKWTAIVWIGIVASMASCTAAISIAEVIVTGKTSVWTSAR